MAQNDESVFESVKLSDDFGGGPPQKAKSTLADVLKARSSIAAITKAKTMASARNKNYRAQKSVITTPHNDPDFPSVRGKFSPERMDDSDGTDINIDSPVPNHKKNAKSIENVIEIKSLQKNINSVVNNSNSIEMTNTGLNNVGETVGPA